jgi:glycosyltransferase involved in cell wall biosynthesis
MKIFIHPNVNIYYSAFYIKGLIDIFGKDVIVYDAKPFLQSDFGNNNFNFIIVKDFLVTRFSIDYNDSYEIHKVSYEWCDVYGNVNTNWSKTPEEYKVKLKSLAPSFGIQLWNLPNTVYHSIANFIKRRSFSNVKKFLGKYKRQYALRLPIEDYFPITPKANYVFHVSTLWYSDEWNKNDESLNRTRSIFMDICKSIKEIQFEGGFYYDGKHPLNKYFKHLVFNRYLPMKIYMEKLQQSVLVFNTPAFWNCHGWKLGEYLALGKAIISTPLSNDLPEPLVHGENIHFVSEDLKEIKDAILLICRDKEYREKISKGAYDYYLRNATPVTSLGLLGIKKF